MCIIYYYFFYYLRNQNINSFKDLIIDDSFEFYYSKYLCSFFILNSNRNCTKEILNNYDFFYDVEKIKGNITVSIDVQKSLIENVFFLIGIIPFLKFNSTLEYNINCKECNKLFKILFKYKEKKDKKIIINITDFETIQNNFNNLINYIWEFPLHKKIILDNIRFIISNYYNDTCLYLFEKALNNNYYYYIKNNYKFFSNLNLKELISKKILFI